MLPGDCRPAMHAARLLYREIGHELRRRGANSVDRRAIVPRSRKAWRLLGAVTASCVPRAPSAAAPLPEARFLVELAAEHTPAAQSRPYAERLAWVIALFERLERLERADAGAVAGP